MMFQLQTSIKAAGISKPLLDSFVDAFRRHGQYCPLDDRVYMVLSPSTLARYGQAIKSGPSGWVRNSAAAGSSSGPQDLAGAGTSFSDDSLKKVNGEGSGGRIEQEEPQHTLLPSNSLPVYLAASAGKASRAVNAAERCIWRQTTARVKKGEEIVQAVDQHRCNWPGF